MRCALTSRASQLASTSNAPSPSGPPAAAAVRPGGNGGCPSAGGSAAHITDRLSSPAAASACARRT
eukprot:353281-Chlamydomonas_euryale.AAC.5